MTIVEKMDTEKGPKCPRCGSTTTIVFGRPACDRCAWGR